MQFCYTKRVKLTSYDIRQMEGKEEWWDACTSLADILKMDIPVECGSVGLVKWNLTMMFLMTY